MAVPGTNQLLAGRYRVERLLGSGGMAAVYLAQDERLERRVAVKRLHAHSTEDAARRFAREAKLGASLSHPNLVWVFDTVADDEGVLIVMEYVDGPTLARELEVEPLRTRRAVEIISGVAAALDHAHEHGIVHRDVKPANVLLGHRGTVKLADLGIATAAEQTRITQSGTLLGTASYMAPEQLEARPPGPPADIYALATVAFEALTGRKARSGRTPVEVAHAIATGEALDLREAWPQAPAEAAEVLKRGMARDPAERPQSACELAGDLARALGEEPAAQARFSAARGATVGGVAAAGAVPETERPETEPAVAAPRPGPRAEAPPAPPPAPEPRVTSHRSDGRPGRAPVLLALGLIAAAVLVIAVLALGSNDDGSIDRAADERPAPSRSNERSGSGGATGSGETAGSGDATGSGGTAGSGGAAGYQPPAAPSGGSAEGARLNSQGFALMRQGRFREAVPVLRRAVAAFPAGTGDLNYAYALYNLGRSLRLSGRPAEAIPILERRLRIPNQTETVRRELEVARRGAGRD